MLDLRSLTIDLVVGLLRAGALRCPFDTRRQRLARAFSGPKTNTGKGSSQTGAAVER